MCMDEDDADADEEVEEDEEGWGIEMRMMGRKCRLWRRGLLRSASSKLLLFNSSA
jgi:hypothetical protein